MRANVWNNWSPRRPRVIDIEKYVNELGGPNPLIMYGDRHENSAGDVADLMNALRKLANKSKAAIVFAGLV
jgi:hypothetical protein